jgi:hypothetical protein
MLHASSASLRKCRWLQPRAAITHTAQQRLLLQACMRLSLLRTANICLQDCCWQTFLLAAKLYALHCAARQLSALSAADALYHTANVACHRCCWLLQLLPAYCRTQLPTNIISMIPVEAIAQRSCSP